jgi:4-methyl-5(b-hydroxyethyl)-thiazole monophosphate biosynthesis
MPKTVLVPIADGTEELEAVSIVDILRRAGVQVTVASVGGVQVTASRRTRLVADALIGDCAGQAYDMIACPGGMPGSEHLRDSVELTALLMAQKEAGRFIAAICAAPVVVLQHHGLIAGRRATCHPSVAERLQCRDALEERVVVDGNLITSRGPGTAIEFGLELVAQLFGRDKAREVGWAMLAHVVP